MIFLKHEIQYRSLCGKCKVTHNPYSLTLFQMCVPQSYSAGLGFVLVADLTCVTRAQKH